MKLNIKSILYLGVILVAGLSSCKKENITMENSFPEIPVTVANKFATFTSPTVKTSFAAGGAIQIVLSIPASSGRTIKEITRVGISTVSTGYSSVQTTTGLYNTDVIPGSGTTVTFNTTLADYYTKAGIAPSAQYTTATVGTATSLLPRYFFFMVTLDNGQVLITTSVRVYVDN